MVGYWTSFVWGLLLIVCGVVRCFLDSLVGLFPGSFIPFAFGTSSCLFFCQDLLPKFYPCPSMISLVGVLKICLLESPSSALEVIPGQLHPLQKIPSGKLQLL